MFKNAIVRRPCANMVSGLTSANLGLPDVEIALKQHDGYIQALEVCGLFVTMLNADEDYPDSTFVEDPALVTRACAIITRPGAASRRGETPTIRQALERFYDRIEMISEPGTLEGGDVMMVGNHFYIGLSERTNANGADQLISILRRHGMDGTTISMDKMLHLKTGVACLENNNLVVAGEFKSNDLFSTFNRIKISDDEMYAANCIWVNEQVIMPAGFPRTRKRIEEAGYETIALDMSEFQKLDGGVSCLSLRF